MGTRLPLVLGGLLMSLGGVVRSANPTPEPVRAGTYYLERGGYGPLTVGPEDGGTQTFAISVVGGNAHTCEVGGVLHAGVVRLEGSADQKPCLIHFQPLSSAVDVASEGASCSDYCGARARFDGHYLRVRPPCEPKRIRATRDASKRLYDQKEYAASRDLLVALLDACAVELDVFDKLWVRNDIAVAEHHLGDDASCLKTLEPARDLAETPDSEVAGGEPAYAEVFLRIARATRQNLKLCRSGAPKLPARPKN